MPKQQRLMRQRFMTWVTSTKWEVRRGTARLRGTGKHVLRLVQGLSLFLFSQRISEIWLKNALMSNQICRSQQHSIKSGWVVQIELQKSVLLGKSRSRVININLSSFKRPHYYFLTTGCSRVLTCSSVGLPGGVLTLLGAPGRPGHGFP